MKPTPTKTNENYNDVDASLTHGKSGAATISNTKTGRSFRFTAVVVAACMIIGVSVAYSSVSTDKSMGSMFEEEPRDVIPSDMNSRPRRKLSAMQRLLESEPEPSDDATKEEELIKKIAEKLTPVSLKLEQHDQSKQIDEEEGKVESLSVTKKKDEKQKMIPHQFLHLHHMKTGGTSIDHLLRCAMSRLRKANYEVPYYSIHECGRSRWAKCLTDPDNSCREKMNKASVMSYCAALKYLDEFGWWNDSNMDNEVKAFTVLRNPVDRVWSMFRFQTKNCYKCMPLKEIYEKLDNGEDTGLDKLCLAQIQNHEVNNLLSTEWEVDVTELDVENNESHRLIADEMVQEAIENMKGFFTVVGITEELVGTSTILGKVFPWMHLDGNEEEGTSGQCPLEHANSSPKNNHCGEKNSHWDLPKQPDQETMELIMKHNSMDMVLYEAAVAYFDLQQRALELNERQ